jgi:surface carbohydrate biosynthesis protein
MRIHLLCDHKWRDLPNLVALQVRLKRLGHTVLLSATKDAHSMIGAFRPDCVVLNHLFSAAHRNLAKTLRSAGIAVIVLPTEGAMRPEFAGLCAGEFTDFTLADLILAWSEEAAKSIRDRWGMDAERLPVAGCGRLDFYHDRFSGLVDTRDNFCQQYGLETARPIVTWATQYGYAYLASTGEDAARKHWLREIEDVGVATVYRRIGLDPEDVPMLFAKGRDAAAHAFFALCKAMPDVQFLIKPHPIEELGFYHGMMDEYGCSNVRFCPGTYIWNVLNATDIELHRQCTTAVEDWMWGKPTIEMGMDFVPQWSWPEREAGSDNAADTEALIALVRGHIVGAGVSEQKQAYRRKYIERWFGPADGRRCATTGDMIDAFLRQRGSRRRYFSGIPGLKAGTRESLGAVLRWQLDFPPNQPLLSRPKEISNSVAHDKLIVRSDVAAYRRRIGNAVD